MKILKIIEQHRRDFTAIYECEYCGHTYKGYGYDDSNFHNNVIPKMICSFCHQKADTGYRPLKPKYPDGMVI